MTRAIRTTSWRIWAATASVIVVIAVLRPWTIEPITHGTRRHRSTRRRMSTPSGRRRSCPRSTASAVDIVSLAHESSPASSAGRGDAEERVRERHGRGGGRGPDVSRRHRARAVRDRRDRSCSRASRSVRSFAARRFVTRSPFITFSDFTNQLDYADVASALNARVLGTALATHRRARAQGTARCPSPAPVTPSGADPRTWQIVPVIMTSRRTRVMIDPTGGHGRSGGEGHHEGVSRHDRARRRRFLRLPRPRARAHRREWRRQIDARQDSWRRDAADVRLAASRRPRRASPFHSRRGRARHPHHSPGTAALSTPVGRRQPVRRPRTARPDGASSIGRAGVDGTRRARGARSDDRSADARGRARRSASSRSSRSRERSSTTRTCS